MDTGTKIRYAASVLFLIILLAAVFFLDKQPKQGANLCTGEPGGNVVILIDYSDDIKETTHKAMKDRIEKLVSDGTKIRPNDRVSVFLLTDNLSKVEPVFDFCSPITGGNPLISNPEIQAVFQSFFQKKLKDGVSQKPKAVQSSPIIEMISTIGRTSYFNENRRSLIIFSDLLQHSKDSVSLYTACSGGGSPSEKAQAAALTYRRNAQSYPPIQLGRDVHVELHQIPRPEQKNLQQACLTSFWQDVFGLSVPSFDPLP